jgi:hypothetical protein
VLAEALAARLLISSLTIEIWRSFRIVSFGTYHGASVIIRRVFGSVREFLLDVHVMPQSSAQLLGVS